MEVLFHSKTLKRLFTSILMEMFVFLIVIIFFPNAIILLRYDLVV